jgi:two-component system, chemotaxis family, protein-glutamate methylesterase/glutaminase
MRILVVDDSIVFRSQISSALNGVEGIEVVATAANGKIALQKLEQLNVDLVTLDMEMPELNGMDTLKAIRAKQLKVKVIVFFIANGERSREGT